MHVASFYNICYNYIRHYNYYLNVHNVVCTVWQLALAVFVSKTIINYRMHTQLVLNKIIVCMAS